MSLLLKVPLLFAVARSLQITLTAPNPPAKRSSEERAKYVRDHKTKELLPLPHYWGPRTYKMMAYAITSLEIFVILLYNFQHILGTSFAGDLPARVASRIRISPTFIVGTLFAIFGASIRASCYRHMGRYFTFELTLQKDHQLITSGPYSIVRHPSYLGSFAFYVGFMLSTFGDGSFWRAADLWERPVASVFGIFYVAWPVYVCTVLFARVAREDAVLKREFKEQWTSWAQKTPYKLIPLVY